jgi:hypothetical protein
MVVFLIAPGCGPAVQAGADASVTGPTTEASRSGAEGSVSGEVGDGAGYVRSCWSWTVGGAEPSSIFGVAADESGSAFLVGSVGVAPLLAGIDTAGASVWTTTPGEAGTYHDVALLPTAAIVAVGFAGPAGSDDRAVVHAYDSSGVLAWTWRPSPGGHLLSAVHWWPAAERIVVGGSGPGEVPTLIAIDSSGELDRVLDAGALAQLGAIAPLGDGFAVCGGVRTPSGASQWAVAGYDGNGEIAWTLEGDEDGESWCSDLEGDGSRLVLAIDQQGPGGGYTSWWKQRVASIAMASVAWTWSVDLDGPTIGGIGLHDDGTTFVLLPGLDAVILHALDASGTETWSTMLGLASPNVAASDVLYRAGRLYEGGINLFGTGSGLEGYANCWDVTPG